MWVVAIALVFLAVIAICLVVPLSIGIRAPDESDVMTLRVRHPALSADVWLPFDIVLHWIAGIPEPPPIAGHVIGIPVPQRALQPVADAIARAVSGAAKPPKPEPPKKVAGRFDRLKADAIEAAPKAALGALPRFHRAVRLDVFSFDLEYGTGDPVSTGMIAGFLWQLASVLPSPATIRAQASWLEARFRLEGEARVLIFPWRTIVAVLCLGFAIVRGAWKAHRTRPPTKKEIEPWPNRTGMGTETPAAVAPPSSPS